MYSTISNPYWTINVWMVNSERLQQAIPRSTVTPAGTDGLYSAWQRKNTWVLGTHGARRSELWVIHPSKHKWNRNEIWRMKKKAFAPFFGLASSFWPVFFMVLFYLFFLFALHLSEDWVDGVEGEFVGQGGLIPPLRPVSFLLFLSTPMHFLHLSVGIFKRESSLTDDANML